MPRSKLRIDLGSRDCFAGLRYGIEGMRVGGRRELRIESHLAYGAKGVPGRIPPHATLRCIVELLEVRERGVVKPEDYPAGRQLQIGWLGDLAHGVAKWQFGLSEDGRCHTILWGSDPWHEVEPLPTETCADAAGPSTQRNPDR